MSENVSVYDLGELANTPSPQTELAPGVRARRAAPEPKRGPAAAAASARRSAFPAVAGSLSLWVPGSGQLMVGELAWGIFFLSQIGVLSVLTWSLHASVDRLVPTLELLELPRASIAWVLAALWILAAAVHVSSVLHAHALGLAAGASPRPLPVLAALASAMVPGWGQILAGHRSRAALFLASGWMLGAAWATRLPAAERILRRCGVHAADTLTGSWGWAALVTLTAVTGALGVYDAAAGAAGERRIR